MSPLPVVDEFGSEKSRPVESTQREAQGEFGVTCKPVVCCVRREISRIDIREAISPGESV